MEPIERVMHLSARRWLGNLGIAITRVLNGKKPGIARVNQLIDRSDHLLSIQRRLNTQTAAATLAANTLTTPKSRKNAA